MQPSICCSCCKPPPSLEIEGWIHPWSVSLCIVFNPCFFSCACVSESYIPPWFHPHLIWCAQHRDYDLPVDDHLIKFADAILCPERAFKEVANFGGQMLADSPDNRCRTVSACTSPGNMQASVTSLSTETSRPWSSVITEISRSLLSLLLNTEDIYLRVF